MEAPLKLTKGIKPVSGSKYKPIASLLKKAGSNHFVAVPLNGAVEHNLRTRLYAGLKSLGVKFSIHRRGNVLEVWNA